MLGKARAKQDQHADDPNAEVVPLEQRARVLPLLLHGDAAFAGQGVVAECFGLSGLRGHRTAGSIHFIINNQIGFTTNPRFARSSPYPSDIAKMVEAPIFHCNGDDPEAVVYAAKIATEFRQKFHKPVVIDMFCYRRFGHNEGDEPAFTQPLMYKAIADHPSTFRIYADKLIGEGLVTEAEVEELKATCRAGLEIAFEAGHDLPRQQGRLARRRLVRAQGGRDRRRAAPRRHRRSSIEKLKQIGTSLTEVPPDFHAHRTIQRVLDARRKAIETGVDIDWATAESLAFGSLLEEGHRVRLSGQDSERGTFSQRHSVLYDQETEQRYIPLNHLTPGPGALRGHQLDAVGGGGARLRVRLLALRAQRTGPVGGAVRRLRQRRAGRHRPVHLVRRTEVAPHVGAGHAPAARLRGPGTGALLGPARALPAALRRGQHAGRKLHDAGQLLPHPPPPVEARVPEAAHPDDAEVAAPPQAGGVDARRDGTRTRPSIACSGTMPSAARARRRSSSRTRRSAASCSAPARSITTSTRSARSAASTTSISSALEQLYPFPAKALITELSRFKNAEMVWCQEEPKNMGAWSFAEPYLEWVLEQVGGKSRRPRYVGRAASAATATGLMSKHLQQLHAFLDEALAV